MIETNLQQQQQDAISQQLSPPHPGPQIEVATGTGPTITCSICEAMYAPSPQQAPFLQHAQGVLDATFMGVCHFCFRCRRAACPQCWDEVHGVCGSCVREAGLPFRISATPLNGLVFPPTAQASLMPSQPQNSPLFVPVRNGLFYSDPPARPEASRTDITTEPTCAVQSQSAAIALSEKTSLPDDSQDTREQVETPRVVQKAKKASRLEQILTWIVLVIVLILIGVIALAEFIPAINALVARMAHIDIHAEIAYLVHIVQQHFKR